jgi:hypothetical protein
LSAPIELDLAALIEGFFELVAPALDARFHAGYGHARSRLKPAALAHRGPVSVSG